MLETRELVNCQPGDVYRVLPLGWLIRLQSRANRRDQSNWVCALSIEICEWKVTADACKKNKSWKDLNTLSITAIAKRVLSNLLICSCDWSQFMSAESGSTPLSPASLMLVRWAQIYLRVCVCTDAVCSFRFQSLQSWENAFCDLWIRPFSPLPLSHITFNLMFEFYFVRWLFIIWVHKVQSGGITTCFEIKGLLYLVVCQ